MPCNEYDRFLKLLILHFYAIHFETIALPANRLQILLLVFELIFEIVKTLHPR